MAYWIGQVLCDFVPGLEDGVHADIVPSYFMNLAEHFTEARIQEVIPDGSWRTTTNKMIYTAFSKSFPVTKIERESSNPSEYKKVWKRIHQPVFDSKTREVVYLAIHNKLPTSERLFRVGLAADPYCETCLNTCGALEANLVHFFCECFKVSEAWNKLRTMLVSLQPSLRVISNDDLIRLNFELSSVDMEITWLIGTYLAEVWTQVHIKKVFLIKKERFFGWLRFKFKNDQVGARPNLNISCL